MGNANKKAKKEAAQQLAANQTANAAAFMRANQKAIDDEANRQAADLASAQEDDRLARLRDAEMAERAAHLAALKEEAETKVFFSNLLKEDAKIEEEKMKKKKKEKKERQKKKREAEEQLENFEKVCIPTVLLLFIYFFCLSFFPFFFLFSILASTLRRCWRRPWSRLPLWGRPNEQHAQPFYCPKLANLLLGFLLGFIGLQQDLISTLLFLAFSLINKTNCSALLPLIGHRLDKMC